MGNTKAKLHDGDSGPGHSQSSPTDLVVVEGQRNGKFGQNGRLGHSCVKVTPRSEIMLLCI